MAEQDEASIVFSDFPEDVQLIILSFLNPSDISAFSCTSKRFNSLCNADSKLWFSLCHRRFGSKTQIRRWASGKISYKRLYKSLSQLENLIGFWRRSGNSNNDENVMPSLVNFQWGSYFITGSSVLPSKNGGYDVVKTTCLWICLNEEGECVSFFDPECKVGVFDDLGFVENELVAVNVNFMGNCHIVLEENVNRCEVVKVSSSGNLRGEEFEGAAEDVVGSIQSVADQLMTDMYQYFANKTSPVGDRWLRRQRRREKERKCWKNWEPEYYVKIVNCSPTPTRPLQGLWKGICDDMKLEFYLVAYDDIGGIACRRVEDLSKPFSGYTPVFWTSDTTFIESPFSPEEQYIYNSRTHLQPPEASLHIDEAVSRIMYINTSNDMVIPDLADTCVNPRQSEGRIWQYGDGTFGFGFLRDNHIVDLKHITRNDSLLDTR